MALTDYISLRRLSHFFDNLKEYIAGIIQPSGDKEVLNVLSYSSSAPASANEGEYYINSSLNKLYVYNSSDEWQEETPSIECIFITSDTSHIYLWNGNAFIDATGQSVDNTIYVRDITTSLEPYNETAVYTVFKGLPGLPPTIYTLIVKRTRIRVGLQQIPKYSQTLMNNEGYWTRQKNGSEAWTEWEEFLYASKKDLDAIIVSNLTTDLAPFTKAGEYHIVFKHQLRPDRPDTIEIPFILLVQVYPNGDIIQVRWTTAGYIYRVKAYDSESWGEWSEQYTYASKDDIEEAKQWAAIGWVL